MAAMWLVPGLLFAAAAATAAAGELECPQAASAAGSQCGPAADADQTSDDVAMLSVDQRSFLSTRSGSQSASQESDETCFCAAKEPTEASETPVTPYGKDRHLGWQLGCQEKGKWICSHLSSGHGCDSCCTTPAEDSAECRRGGNPEQAATGTVDYNTIVNILPSLAPPAAVTPVNGFMATGCVGDPYYGRYATAGYSENSAVFRSLFFTGVRSCEQAQGFYFRAPPNSGRGGCIKYGDDVVIAQTADAAQNQCGWFGCRVAGMQDMPKGNVAPAVMTFDHGGDAPMGFYLQPPVGSGRSGCIQKGDDVVIAQTPNIAKTDNCGWYGCRVAITNTLSGYRSLFFDHGGDAPPTFFLKAAPPGW